LPSITLLQIALPLTGPKTVVLKISHGNAGTGSGLYVVQFQLKFTPKIIDPFTTDAFIIYNINPLQNKKQGKKINTFYFITNSLKL